jgi:enoyl-CoA hydratase
MAGIIVDNPAEGVRRITFNDPETRNAFSYDMYEQTFAALNDLKEDLDTRVLILTGAGKGFCSGHNLAKPPPADWLPPEWGRLQGGQRMSGRISSIPLTIRALPQVVICAVNGAAAGLGYALALVSDVTIAAQSAKFVNAFHNAGAGCEMGFSWLLPRAVGIQRAAEILFSARAVLPDEAERIGMILRAVPDDKLMDEALALAESFKMQSPADIMLTKRSFHINLETPSYAAAVQIESRAVFMLNGTEDLMERHKAAAEKRKPKYRNR